MEILALPRRSSTCGKGLAVHLCYLIQPLEVITEPVASIFLGYDDNGAGPGAGEFLDDALLKYPGYFCLYSLATGLWDSVGLLPDGNSRSGLNVML